ncbi:MAG: class I SAM-dependent methyltransferase [Parvibaculum sp.]|jgi:SAM-dependent methyltransferase|uniref:class I SAM-dependent methyltransferase n=1 Tax=Parvibaculum sp. TaxID=2024848 RepID=UPI002ABD056A|nr:class I SAM-dependent methyltransferase [Parvibaculum sp.]MDZ4379857.1 class I SAM-dependent methyltransferase [Parvibaculum sp.]
MSEQDRAAFALERHRIERMLRRFLIPAIPKGARILSVGCGMGSDVLALRDMGFDAWGVDPSRLSFETLPPGASEYFRIGTIEDSPFGKERFDFVYALDVIEHVGCVNFGTVVTPDTASQRVKFISSCLDVLAPGGVLLLTTSNRLCPVDPGHWHRYHWLGKRFAHRRKPGLSIPWSRKNFLVSLGDVRELVAQAGGQDKFDVSSYPTAFYPSLSERKDIVSKAITACLKLLDLAPFIGSPLAPILIVKITRLD